jgi:hypothetical protein
MEIAHKQNETNPHYAEILERLKIGRIRSMEDIDRLFDTASLMGETAELFVTENTLIFFDTPVFNSAYLLDEYDGFMRIHNNYDLLAKALKPIPGMDEATFEEARLIIFDKISRVVPAKAYYCDDIETHRKLFEPFALVRKMPTDTPPSVLIISPAAKTIFIDMEAMYPIDIGKMVMAHVMLHDAVEMNAHMVEMEKVANEERRAKAAGNPDIN